MSTILEYPCGCQFYSDSKTIDVMHLCDEHKIQACTDALQEVIPQMLNDTTQRSLT